MLAVASVMPLLLLLLASFVVPVPTAEAVEVSCLFKKSCIFPCHIQGRPSQIMWTREMFPVQSYPLNENHHHHYRYINKTELFEDEVPEGNCSLLLKDVQPQDKGRYECSTKSENGSKTLFYNVNVNAPVEMVNTVQSGDTLICSSERIFPKPNLTWSSPYFSNSSHLNTSFYVDSLGLYSINSTLLLHHNDSQYSCNVSTPHSWRSAYYMQLSPVTFTGTETMLNCTTSSAPVKRLTWMFNHTQTILNMSSENQSIEVSDPWKPFMKNISEPGNLLLGGLTSDQQGMFTCHFQTDKETYTVNMWLNVEVSSGLIVPIAICVTLLLTFIVTGISCKSGQNTSEAEAFNSGPSRPQRSHSNPPQDRCHAVRIICVILGLGSELPSQFFVTASLYFKSHMNAVNQTWTISLLVLVWQLSHLLPVVLNSCFHLRMSLQKHTIGCLTLIPVLFVLEAALTKVQMAGGNFFCISMCVLWLSSLLSAMLRCNVCKLVSLLPDKYRSYTPGLGGVLASVTMICCVATTKDSDSAAFYYFIFALCAGLVALISFLLLQQLEFAKHYFSPQCEGEEERPLELQDTKHQMNDSSQENTHSFVNKLPRFFVEFCVALVPAITLSVYPAITADVQTLYPETSEPYFILAGCFFNFNIFCCIGQTVASKVDCAGRLDQVIFPILAFVRIAFIPLFMFCNVQRRSVYPVNPFLSHDATFIIIMLFFSFSHSFLLCLSMRERSTGPTRVLCESFGLVIGAALSFAIRAGI